MDAAEAPRAPSFAIMRGEEPRDRQKLFFGNEIEDDSQIRVVVSPRGRSEERRMERLLRPGDATVDREEPSRRQAQRDVDAFARSESCCGGDPQASETDVGAARERGGGLAVLRGHVDGRAERKSRGRAGVGAIPSKRSAHVGLPSMLPSRIGAGHRQA